MNSAQNACSTPVGPELSVRQVTCPVLSSRLTVSVHTKAKSLACRLARATFAEVIA